MSKPFDGGISTKPFTSLMRQIESLNKALIHLATAVAAEEHESSLVPEDSIDTARCIEITKQRKIVDLAIGSDTTSGGLLQILFECGNSMGEFISKVDKLKDTFSPVAREPTGKPGNC